MDFTRSNHAVRMRIQRPPLITRSAPTQNEKDTADAVRFKLTLTKNEIARPLWIHKQMTTPHTVTFTETLNH